MKNNTNETINGKLSIKVSGWVEVDRSYANNNTGKHSHNHNRANLDVSLDMEFDQLNCSTRELVDGIKEAVFSANKQKTEPQVEKTEPDHSDKCKSLEHQEAVVNKALVEFTNAAITVVDLSRSKAAVNAELSNLIDAKIKLLMEEGESETTIDAVMAALYSHKHDIFTALRRYRKDW